VEFQSDLAREAHDVSSVSQSRTIVVLNVPEQETEEEASEREGKDADAHLAMRFVLDGAETFEENASVHEDQRGNEDAVDRLVKDRVGPNRVRGGEYRGKRKEADGQQGATPRPLLVLIKARTLKGAEQKNAGSEHHWQFIQKLRLLRGGKKKKKE
jgi:hypothetical protein